MTFTLYHNNNCSKSRLCKSILEKKKIKIEIREYIKKPLTLDEIQELYVNLDGEKNKVFRKTPPILGKKDLIKYLFENQNLMQRPIFFNGSKYIICRPPELVLELI